MLTDQTVKKEHLLLENEFHQGFLKELVETRCVKEESFCENDNEPVVISRHKWTQAPLGEQTYDLDIKSDLFVEESKPVLKELVALAPDMLRNGTASPIAQVKNEFNGHFSDVDTLYRSTSSEEHYEKQTEEKNTPNEIFQGDITRSSQSIFPPLKETVKKANVIEEHTHVGKETRSPKITKNNVRCRRPKSISGNFQEIFCCDTCGKSFLRKCHLTRHIRNHLDKQPYVCNICGLTYSRTDSLRRHKTLHIPIPVGKLHKSHICDVCGKGFSNRTYLKRHSIVHGNRKGYLCDKCGKTFTQFGDMKRHTTVHTGRELQECDTCGKSFQERVSLLRHQVQHSKDKLLYCNFCGRSFTRKDCLQSHIAFRHMPEKPFVCKSCGKGYTHHAPFQAHIYSHLNLKPFCCADCEKCFTSAANLRQHSLKVHTSQKTAKPK